MPGMPYLPMTTYDGPWNADVGCVDWQSHQWQAWFKSIPFAVDSDTWTGGRRIHVHEYPAREYWDNEDLGRLRQSVEVNGYVFGDESDKWAEQLFGMCVDPSVGELYLPMRTPKNARCLQVESTFIADRMGRIDFSMRFTLETDLPPGIIIGTPITPTYLELQVVNAANAVERAARGVFELEFTGSQPQPARTAAVTQIKLAAVNLSSALVAARTSTHHAAQTKLWIQSIAKNAEALADLQATKPNVLSRSASVYSQEMSRVQLLASISKGLALRTSTGQVLPQVSFPHEGFGGRFQQALRILIEGSSYPEDLAQALFNLSEQTPTILVNTLQSSTSAASVRAELQLADTVASFVRRLAIARTCAAGTKTAPEKQPDATLVRDRLRTMIDVEVEKLSGYVVAYDAMRKLRSALIAFIGYWADGGAATERLGNLAGAPLAKIAAERYIKSFGNRDAQLMRLNGIRHPLFPPSLLSARRE